MKTGLVAWLLLVLIGLPSAHAAVTFSSDTPNNSSGDDVPSISVAGYTISGACTQPLLVAWFTNYFSVGTVTSATYNTVPLSLRTPLTGSATRVEVWYLVNPPTGVSATLTFNFSQNITGAVGAMALCGADQTTPFGTSVTQQATLTEITDTVTVPANGLAVEVVSLSGGMTLAPINVGATAQWTDNSTAGTGTGGAQTRSTTGAMGWTWDDTFQFVAHIAVPINAAVVPSGVRRRVMNMYQ